MPKITVTHENGFMHVECIHTRLVLDTQTNLVSGFYEHFYVGNQYRGCEFIELEHDSQGRLVYLREMNCWWSWIYNGEGKVTQYEDSRGNAWDSRWEIPFLYTNEISHITYMVSSRFYRINNFIKQSVRQNKHFIQLTYMNLCPNDFINGPQKLNLIVVPQ